MTSLPIILNSPFEAPSQHFDFDATGLSSKTIKQGRRPSSYFIPIPPAKKKGKAAVQASFVFEEKREENALINRLRGKILEWRMGGWKGVTSITRALLDHWTREDRERRLFFCQLEAVETAIYLTEVAPSSADGKHTLEALRIAQQEGNSLLPRIAFKMATGTGKTTVMALLIAWQTLNHLEFPSEKQFSSNFLIVAPGITIRDRLRVLLPNMKENTYRTLDLVPQDLFERLLQARIVLTNYHSFQRREMVEAATLTKKIATGGNPEMLKETWAQMVRRVCSGLDPEQKVIVLNDEAHHCYLPKPVDAQQKLTGEEKKEAQENTEQARQWHTGLTAIHKHFSRKGGGKRSIVSVFDLSATPFYLRGSGYSEGTLFPWVVSDFSLVDAIEAGIVKIPRVPVADNSMTGDMPVYRELWPKIREHLPRKRSADEDQKVPTIPVELEAALKSLYASYEAHFRKWEAVRGEGAVPPVFIVVCSNTAVSSLVYRHIAGWTQKLQGDTLVTHQGALPLFSNFKPDGAPLPLPRTILVDSAQLEAGEGLSEDFRKVAAREIEDFKRAFRAQYGDRDASNLSDSDLLREVMNTVGKPGKLGASVRCVVSVSMLTEGWDTNTVTHILGVRAFSTQLLCEQVVGRGLRRVSYELGSNGKFSPEYAEIYGVPFRFVPTDGATAGEASPVITQTTRIQSLDARSSARIVFPRVIGYRHELSVESLSYRFSGDSKLTLSTKDIPTRTELRSILGDEIVHSLGELRMRRRQEVAYWLAKHTLERHFVAEGGGLKHWLFPDILAIARLWIDQCVSLQDDTFFQLLLLTEHAHLASQKIFQAISAGTSSEHKQLLPILSVQRPIGSTDRVDFETSRPVWPTLASKCHLSHVVGDTNDWEQKCAQALEDMEEVVAYAKNDHLDFFIPYTIRGIERRYYPDFLARIDHPELGRLNLVLECSGQKRAEKEAKVAAARNLWVPAINNLETHGTWAFFQTHDPWNLKNDLRAFLKSLSDPSILHLS